MRCSLFAHCECCLCVFLLTLCKIQYIIQEFLEFRQTIDLERAWVFRWLLLLDFFDWYLCLSKSLHRLTHSFINTYFWLAVPSIGNLGTYYMYVIWPVCSEWHSVCACGVGGNSREGFYWFGQGQSKKMLPQQNRPVLFCLVRQYSRLSCQLGGDTIDSVTGGELAVVLIY